MHLVFLLFSRIYSGLLIVLLSMFVLTACNQEQPIEKNKSVSVKASENTEELTTYEYTGILVSDKERQEQTQFPELKKYKENIKLALQKDIPILLLDREELSEESAFQAQLIAIQNKQFIQYTRHPENKSPLRNEIMTVRKVLAGDIQNSKKQVLESCKTEKCYRVEMYNFFFNLSNVAFVNTDTNRVLSVNVYSKAQPDLSKRLTKLAIEIAKTSDLVKQELGEENIQPTMAEIKTSLKNSRCERSHHLCVAPTFVKGDKALWAIVDLTDGDLVGVRWTELGDSGPPIQITERQLENEFVFSQYCEQSQHHQQGDWQFDYQITSSDGLQLTDVKFKDKLVMKSVKLLDWHVSYSSRENFGYSDAIGCPLFSSAVVVAYDGPKVEKLKSSQSRGTDNNSFAFIQDFRQPPWPTPCNYRYEQRFEFFDDGKFRVAAADLGRGCGTDGTYRPVIRIDLEASNSTDAEQIAQWDGTAWHPWTKEDWTLQNDDTKYTKEGYQFKFTNKQGQGYYIEPNRGQFNDDSKGDFAFTYFTVNHKDKDEAKSDMVTIGSCCNTDHKQGPEQFMEPAEDLSGKNLVMWYVPQIKNEGKKGEEYCWADSYVDQGIAKIKVWPCYAGPMFIPIQSSIK